MTRQEIEAMQPGVEMNVLVGQKVKKCKVFAVSDSEEGEITGYRMIENGHYQNLPDYSRDMNAALTLMYDDHAFDTGLFIAQLNNGKWICGRASHIYDIKISDDLYKDRELVIADTAPEVICKMRLILALCPEEAKNSVA